MQEIVLTFETRFRAGGGGGRGVGNQRQFFSYQKETFLLLQSVINYAFQHTFQNEKLLSQAFPFQ
jgi:hypothetical protein